MKTYLNIILILVFSIISCKNAKTEEPKSKSKHAKTLKSIAKDFMELVKKGDYSRVQPLLSKTMKEKMTKDFFNSVWKNTIYQWGKFEGVTEIKEKTLGKYTKVFLTYKFKKISLVFQVVFNKKKKIAGFWIKRATIPYKPPSYADKSKFKEINKKIGLKDWLLPATISLPKGTKICPGVVLVHGSGPNDRDETIGGCKVFKDLAWGLASQGIAVLRYDKRTKTYPQRMNMIKEKLTVKEESIDDAVEAVKALQAIKSVDPSKIYVIGHSLGGTIFPRIGKAYSKIAGFISMAGSVRPMEDLVLDQYTYICMLDGKLSKEEKEGLDVIKKQVARVKDPKLSAKTPSKELPLSVHAKYWLDLRGYNSAKEATKLKQRLLILQGGRDYQVTKKDFTLWKKELGDKKNVTFKLYPKLNHLFISGENKSEPQEYFKPGNVSKAVIDDIANWIKEK